MNSVTCLCYAIPFDKVWGFSWAPGLRHKETPQREDLFEPGFRLYSGKEILIFPYGDPSSAWEKRFDLLSPFVLTVGYPDLQ
jgi:hypothetical protein